MENTIHKFEKAGLGSFPYRYMGYSEATYQACPGAPVQASGMCDYCGACIRHCFHLRSADGREFKVGSDCIGKSGDAGMKKAIAADVRKHERDVRYARAQKTQDELRAVIDANDELLASFPHPRGFSGLSLLDYAVWMWKNAGAKGHRDALKAVKAAIAAKEVV